MTHVEEEEEQTGTASAESRSKVGVGSETIWETSGNGGQNSRDGGQNVYADMQPSRDRKLVFKT